MRAHLLWKCQSSSFHLVFALPGGEVQPSPPRTHTQSLHFSCSGRYPVSDDPQDSPSKPAVYRVLSYSEDEEIAFQPHSVAFNFLKL